MHLHASLLLSSAILCCFGAMAYPADNDDSQLNIHDELIEPAAAEMYIRRVRRAPPRWLDCKEQDAACYGFPPCCDSMVCYWPNGYRLGRAGTCISCVGQGQQCQRDGQCCESLVCQKANGYDVNGVCDAKRANGAECHDNDQCVSEYCKIHPYNNVVMGHGGTCADRE